MKTRTVHDLDGESFEVSDEQPIPVDDDTPEELEAFETIWGTIETANEPKTQEGD